LSSSWQILISQADQQAFHVIFQDSTCFVQGEKVFDHQRGQKDRGLSWKIHQFDVWNLVKKGRDDSNTVIDEINIMHWCRSS